MGANAYTGADASAGTMVLRGLYVHEAGLGVREGLGIMIRGYT